VINYPPLVLDLILGEAVNQFAYDRLRLITTSDWSEFFDILSDAAHFMLDTEKKITHDDIESPLFYWGAEKGPWPIFSHCKTPSQLRRLRLPPQNI
jgi:hypothetical protein